MSKQERRRGGRTFSSFFHPSKTEREREREREGDSSFKLQEAAQAAKLWRVEL